MIAVAPVEQPITEGWLRSVGFRWHEMERQGAKHWVLWLAGAFSRGDTEDLGLELADCAYGTDKGTWFCWLRCDMAHRYHRFIHVRHLRYQEEVIRLVEAITGLPWTPEDHLYGAVRSPKHAAYIREQEERIDRRMRRDAAKWQEIEKDDTRGQALPEHMEAAVKAGVAK